MVSLSSAESELHALVSALVSGACDGICLKHSLQFLTRDDVHHICWVDNSATRQIACKRGAGKLCHVSGNLLWCQEKVGAGSLRSAKLEQSAMLRTSGRNHYPSIGSDSYSTGCMLVMVKEDE